ncbi:MAG: hypothetical protein WC134_01965 [Acholeplasmataceae bacterium]
MKIKKIIIKDELGKVLFKGPLLNLTFKKDAIKRTCIELFNDDDPCIIHESYAIQKLSDDIERSLLSTNQKTFQIDQKFQKTYANIDFSLYDKCLLELEVKK